MDTQLKDYSLDRLDGIISVSSVQAVLMPMYQHDVQTMMVLECTF